MTKEKRPADEMSAQNEIKPNIEAYIRSIQFSDKININLQNDSILVLVGPNNSGKSASLNYITSKLIDDPSRPSPACPIQEFKLDRISTLEEVRNAITPFATSDSGYNIGGFQFQPVILNHWWNSSTNSIGNALTGLIVSDLTTRARLGDCEPANSFDARIPQSATHPFQRMWRDRNFEFQTSDIVRRAFKADLVLHRFNNKTIPVYIGERPKLSRGEERGDYSYSQKVESLDRLELQGDGLRSFVSIISRVITEQRPIQLIDEPEAFLHPPQARLVAESIVCHSKGRQTLIATHSNEILQGLLAAASERVSVVRLSRNNGVSSASYLESNQISSLWKDPILRFSNALDGLFHDGVIVCEADADCRFYESVAEISLDAESRPDIHYTYSGGKDRLATVVSALSSLNVPVATIVDFDVLNNEQPLRKIVTAHGADWLTFLTDWQSVKSAVEERTAFIGGDRFKKDIQNELKKLVAKESVPRGVLESIRKLTRQASAWDQVKQTGLEAVPHGNAHQAANRLLENLRKIGIFIVPKGEMEGFNRNLTVKGARWVEAVLATELTTDPQYESAREFMRQVIVYLKGVHSTS